MRRSAAAGAKAANGANGHDDAAITGDQIVDTIAIEFDENAYVSTFADVGEALDTGEFATAREHYEFHGSKEGRLTHEKYIRALGIAPGALTAYLLAEVSIDSVMCAADGTVLVVGWTDDRDSAVTGLSIFAGDGAWNTTSFGRVRRHDAEAALDAPAGHLFGFWSVFKIKVLPPVSAPWVIRVRRADGGFGQAEAKVRMVSELALRSTILGFFGTTTYFGNRDIEAFLALDAGIGKHVIDLNLKITASVLAGAWVSYYGPTRKAYIGSVVVCLYGKHEFMFLQSALFSLGPRAAEYEFIYVSNSPELTETLKKEARICARTYGISIVLICLPDNAGFSAANNIAARYARSSRLLITNPDVFPRDNGWAKRHADIVEGAPTDQTLMFGTPLYYDDGSLMHHGIYFEIEAGVSVRNDRIYERSIIRTEHYGKGAPAWSRNFALPRPVPAITGAFMSIDRYWFEALGGFSEEFIFGHYEDCDLCLKSLVRGKPVWMHDLPLWHMEGKGSVRREAHEGGSLINRWLFTKKWGELIATDLLGPEPTMPAFVKPPAPTAPKPRKINVSRQVSR
jgi:GT2 family glycosyltransferase